MQKTFLHYYNSFITIINSKFIIYGVVFQLLRFQNSSFLIENC